MLKHSGNRFKLFLQVKLRLTQNLSKNKVFVNIVPNLNINSNKNFETNCKYEIENTKLKAVDSKIVLVLK